MSSWYISNVAKFYDDNHGAFLESYGNVLQAYRTKEIEQLLEYEAKSMGLRPGISVLDAGCGMCGPAFYFAETFPVRIEALTISTAQVNAALKEQEKYRSLKGQVYIRQGDYHELEILYGPEAFDLIYFLESFGHSREFPKLLRSVWQALNPGGTFYIKDIFKREIPGAWAIIERGVNHINRIYEYNVPELPLLLSFIRQTGFSLCFVKALEIPLEDREGLLIAQRFLQTANIKLTNDWDGSIFPIESFEIKAVKPVIEVKID